MNKNIPKIRFNGFADPWKKCKLDSIGSFTKGKGYSKGDLNEDGEPIILYGRLYTKYETTIDGVDTFVKAKEGSLYSTGHEVIVPASGESADDIARASAVKKAGILLGGDLNVVIPNEDINTTFLALSISHGESKKELIRKAQGKSVVHIHNEEIQELIIPFPCKEEQDSIAEYLTMYDNLISLNHRKLEKLKGIKKAYLSEMFPQNGERYPKRRFKIFAEPWEQRELKDIFEEFSNKSSVENEYTILSSTSSGMEKRDGRVSGNSNIGYKIIDDGDLVLSPQNLWLGNININNIGKGIVSPSYKTFKLTGVDKRFINPQLRKKELMEAYKNASTQGASVVRRNLEINLFNKITIYVPNTLEQEKIGEFFSILDNLIALQQRKIEKIKGIKKAYLNEMFV